MTSPCYHCQKRSVACHDHCEQYQEWRKFYRAEKDHDKQANALCTIHKGDFDADTWHGKRRRRHK